LWNYVHETIAGGHTGDAEILDKWNDEMSWHIGLSQNEELIREIYQFVREKERVDEVA
jgi:hypothetical protein